MKCEHACRQLADGLLQALVVLRQIEITLDELVHLQLEGGKWVVHRWGQGGRSQGVCRFLGPGLRDCWRWPLVFWLHEGLLGRWPLYAGLLMRSIDGLTVHGDAVLAFFHEVYVSVNYL